MVSYLIISRETSIKKVIDFCLKQLFLTLMRCLLISLTQVIKKNFRLNFLFLSFTNEFSVFIYFKVHPPIIFTIIDPHKGTVILIAEFTVFTLSIQIDGQSKQCRPRSDAAECSI